jgi:hypothetical protein
LQNILQLISTQADYIFLKISFDIKCSKWPLTLLCSGQLLQWLSIPLNCLSTQDISVQIVNSQSICSEENEISYLLFMGQQESEKERGKKNTIVSTKFLKISQRIQKCTHTVKLILPCWYLYSSKKKKKKKKKNAWNSPKYSYLMVIYSPQLSEKPPKKLEKKREKKNG